MANKSKGIALNKITPIKNDGFEDFRIDNTQSEEIEVLEEDENTVESNTSLPDSLPADKSYLSKLTPQQLNLIAASAENDPGRPLNNEELLAATVASKNDYINQLRNELVSAQERILSLTKENIKLRHNTLKEETHRVLTTVGMLAGMPITLKAGKEHFVAGIAPENLPSLSLNIIEELEKLGYHVHDDGQIHADH